MATSGTRDIRLRLSLETLGTDGLRQLAAELRRLAQEGGDAAPEFDRLADEIDRLGEQGNAVNNLQKLSDEAAQLGSRYDQAAARVTELTARLDALKTATATAAQAQQQAQQDYAAGDQVLANIKLAIQALRLEYDAAGRKTQEFATRMLEARQAQTEQVQEVKKLRTALAETTTELTKAERAQAKQEQSLERAAVSAGKLENQLRGANTALDGAREAVQSFGLATDDVAGAQLALAAAVSKVNGEIQQATATREAAAQSARNEAAAQADLIASLNAEINLRKQNRAAAEAAAVTRDREAQATREAAAAAAQWQQEAEKTVNTIERQRAAQERATRATEVQIAAMRELEAQRAFEKQAAAAAELVRQSNRIREIEQAFDEADAAAKKLADDTARINGAFAAINVRPIEVVRAELAEARRAMVLLAEQAATTGQRLDGVFAAGRQRINELEREIRTIQGTLTTADKAASLFSNSLGQIAAGNVIADAVGYLVNKVKELGRAFIDVITQTEATRRALNAVYKDTSVAAAQFNVLNQTALRAGVAVNGIERSFVKFSAAMQTSGIAIGDANTLFANITRSASSLGLTAEETGGALEALGQIASKGTVSLEELRQQLGDRMPGALALAAKGLGLTQQELIKLVESGQLAARDFLPAFAKALNEVSGEVSGLTPAFADLSNILTQFARNAGDAGVTQILVAGLKALSAALGTVLIHINALLEGFSFIVRSAAAVAAAVRTMTSPWENIKQLWADSTDRLTKLNTSIGVATGVIDRNAISARTAATELQRLSVNANLLEVTTLKSAEAQNIQAAALARARAGVLDLGAQYVKLQVEIAAGLERVTKQAEAHDKLAKAAKVEADQILALAALRGSEYDSITASIQASELLVTAQERAAASHRAETELLELQRLAIVRDAEARKLSEEATKVQLATNEKALVASRAATEQANQAALAARNEAMARKLAAETYQDNADKVDRYGKALEAANYFLQRAEEQARAGIITEQQLAAARERQTIALARYNDALSDRTAREAQAVQNIQASNTLEQANLQLQMAKLKAQESKARYDKNEYEIQRSLIAQKELEIKITQLSVAGKIAEQNAQIAMLKLKQAELDVNDPLYKQKMGAIDLSIKAAEASILEARARGENVAQLQRELADLKNASIYRNASSDAIKTETGNLDVNTAARDRNTSAIERQNAALQKQGGLTSDGFQKNKDGSAAGTFNNNLPMDQAYAALNASRGGPAFSGDVAVAQQQAQNFWNWIQAQMKNAPGSISTQAYNDAQAMVNAANALNQKQNAGTIGDGKPAGQYVVAVSINGKQQQPISTASESDAQNLTSMLKNLEKSSTTAARV